MQTAKLELTRTLGLFDSTMLVAGSMIGSGIFIVSAEMSRNVGSPGWLLASWVITGILTLTAALSYGELAAMMPRAGGQYVYLREAFSPMWGFLYGWTLFGVIQTGTIAAVGVAFARYLGVLWPAISESHYLVAPIHLSAGYAVSLSTAQLVGILVILFLTYTNTLGIQYGKRVQNVFTVAKIGSLLGLIGLGLFLGWNRQAVAGNFGNAWTPRGFTPIAPGLTPETSFGLLVALCVAQTGSLFSADAWNNITFTAGEVRTPRRNVPLSLALGTAIVIGLYLLANVAYLVVLPFEQVQYGAARSRRQRHGRGRVPGRRRADHGDRHHDLDLRLHQRHGAGRRARLLRHGAGQPVFSAPLRTVNQGAGPWRRARAAGGVDYAAGAAADLRRVHRKVRQPLRQPAGLCGLGGADFLYPDHCRGVRAAQSAPQ